MNRREFIAGLVKLGISATVADKLELFERLTHKRKFFPGHSFIVPTEFSIGFSITQAMIEDDVMYGSDADLNTLLHRSPWYTASGAFN